ncbi:hypothetical protein HBH56_018940 [Parastagonospora nodorum]|uniref:Uncharacterized protein n=2 Tax=Phaeosphaeria nodorum (strain SN15 / ATCC MYA-4574 / FGSC 10173) TaxID=321614 RepID=A0A7U2EY88_PHANO|nr:hypothetical protein SNOG_03009 [Parastagonospora nodorum SN15]KAH3919800.1 hypothetical protein HBH56_018940 [Parastagonospora nodorum]EAT89740.1 hypothetical protein SNOG_03009 [Parastagonospora nodorum SN15]KAH3937118.1 hypothetical protein HBH54_015550 [Parastagonospora nodorum]KAH3962710.1 hypothetical protein HBH51_174100 [Parastagonospora nodorum]KAH4006690.1 hypothetical protein HBI10_015430 [Parastagonospora nodorum]
MFSTTAFPDDFLPSFSRLYVDSHIRVVSRDEDPRLGLQTDTYTFQRPPKYGQDDFPPLDSAQASDALEVTDTSGAYTYADVLKLSRTTGFDLFEFPPEVRELVWEAAMRAGGTFSNGIHLRSHVYRREEPDRPSFLPRVCFLSRSTRDETVAVFMRNASYIIASIHDNVFLRKFIASVPGGQLNIRELSFRNFDFFPEHDRETGVLNTEDSDLELAVHCEGLRTVHLTMGPRFIGYHVLDEDTGQYDHRFRSTEELVTKYHLRRLLDCERLRTVHWHGLWMTTEHERVLRGLANWVKAEFASRGRKTEYTVT